MKARLAGLSAMILILVCLAAVAMAGSESPYYLNKRGDTVCTKHDSGFSEIETMDSNNPNYGWDIGYFYLTGYTDITYDTQDGSIVFLKNAEDELSVCFDLNIQSLDDIRDRGNGSWRISFDTNGYDDYFQTLPGAKEEDQAGRGYLVIRQTDYNNKTHTPAVYNNYLESVTNGTAETRVKTLAEGDYEVALDYELAMNAWPGGFKDYRIFFRFKVRNSNCMVYLYDNETGNEITNGASINAGGFRIDYKHSHYLTVNVKEMKLAKNSEVYVLDERLDRKAHDGKIYTDKALYIVTVENKYTGVVSEPKYISVGNEKILNIYAAYAGSMDVNDIAMKLADGEEVDTNWLFLISEASAEEEANTDETDYREFKEVTEIEPARISDDTLIIIASIIGASIIIGAIILRARKDSKTAEKKTVNEED